MVQRAKGRGFDQLRDINIERNVNKYAEGSVLVSYGDTRVICTGRERKARRAYC